MTNYNRMQRKKTLYHAIFLYILFIFFYNKKSYFAIITPINCGADFYHKAFPVIIFLYLHNIRVKIKKWHTKLKLFKNYRYQGCHTFFSES